VSNEKSHKQEKVKFFASLLPANVTPKENLADQLRTEENGFIPAIQKGKKQYPHVFSDQ
jgi:hypothetical protein